jgi:porin
MLGGLFPAVHGGEAVAAEYLYTGEMFTNMRGGRSTQQATEYMGLADLVLTGDTEAMGFWKNGTCSILAQNMHGRGISEEYVGDVQILSNIDSPHRMQVSEYWYEHHFLDGDVVLRLGKQDANLEFAVVHIAGDFINSSYGFHPTVPMASYPDGALAAVTLVELTDWLDFEFGIFDGEPDGRIWGFTDSGTSMSLYEFHARYALADEQLPGEMHAGLWYHSGEWDDLAAGSGNFQGAHGFYYGVEQWLTSEEPEAEEVQQGLAAFGQYAWAPEDRSELNHYWSAGIVYHGFLPGRDADILGAGVSTVLFSRYAGVSSPNEAALELFYKCRLTDHLILQPDLQYIGRPSGTYRDAFVFGLRFEATL